MKNFNLQDEYVQLSLNELKCYTEMFKLNPQIVDDFEKGIITVSYMDAKKDVSLIEVKPETKYWQLIEDIEEKHDGIAFHVIDSELQEKPLFLVMMRDSSKMIGYLTKGKREFIFDLIAEDTEIRKKEKASLEGYSGIMYCHDLYPELKKTKLGYK